MAGPSWRPLTSSLSTEAPSVDGLFVLDEPNKRVKVGDARISMSSARASARGSEMGSAMV